MSIRPVNFNEDGSIDVVLDEAGHSGTILAADVRWATNPMDDTDDHNYIVLNCPDGCGSSSTWPVGGGADAIMGQQMFVLKEQQEMVAAGGTSRSAKSMTDAAEIVKQRVIEMDGEARWKLDDAALAALEARGANG